MTHWPLLLACLLTAPAEPQTLTEEVLVREVELVLDVPDAFEAKNLTAGDFTVIEDGQLRRVTRVEPAGRSWSLLVYIDETLASSETVFAAALALAQRAGPLTGLGSVEVVSAGHTAQTLLPATRDASQLAEALARLAEQARLARDKAAVAPPAGASGLERQRLDLLLATVAERQFPGPRALLVVMDGPDLEHARELGAAGRLLAAQGWVTLALPVQREAPTPAKAGPTDAQVMRQHMDTGGNNSVSVPPVIQFATPDAGALELSEVIDLSLTPEVAALRELVRPSAGTVVGFAAQLDLLVADLARRFRLWYSAPDPANGVLRRVEVRLARDETDVAVRAPAWVRSGAPEGLSEARLRRLFAVSSASAGELEVTAAAHRKGSGAQIEVGVEGIKGRVRVSAAFRRKDGSVEIRHDVLSAEGGAVRHSVHLSLPPTADGLAVLVEELGTGKWGGRLLPPLS